MDNDTLLFKIKFVCASLFRLFFLNFGISLRWGFSSIVNFSLVNTLTLPMAHFFFQRKFDFALLIPEHITRFRTSLNSSCTKTTSLSSQRIGGLSWCMSSQWMLLGHHYKSSLPSGRYLLSPLLEVMKEAKFIWCIRRVSPTTTLGIPKWGTHPHILYHVCDVARSRITQWAAHPCILYQVCCILYPWNKF